MTKQQRKKKKHGDTRRPAKVMKMNTSRKPLKMKFQPPRTNTRFPDPNKDINEILEWLGDAVLDELVGRSLLRHVHIFYAPSEDPSLPVSNLELFRQLRDSLVTNSNLCAVYDKLFPSKYTILLNPLKTKQKADAVETLVGRVAKQGRKSAEEFHQLDRILSMMMEVEFTQWAVDQEEQNKKGFNQFSLLEHLIDTDEEDVHSLDDSSISQAENETKSTEIDQGTSKSSNIYKSSTSFHAFGPAKKEKLVKDESILQSIVQVQEWLQGILDPTHILQTSRVMFEIFKLYGMSVLKERTSSYLIQESKSSNPANLTWVRQNILSIDRQAHCASLLHLTEPSSPSKVKANTLRAVIGFASAMPCPHVVETITSLLVYLYQCPLHCEKLGCALTRTEGMDLDELMLHESTCKNSHATFVVEQWNSLPSVTSLTKLPRSAAATIDFLKRRQIPFEKSIETLNEWLPVRWCDLDIIDGTITNSTRKRPRTRSTDITCRKSHGSFTLLQRFAHRRFLFSLEIILISFAKYDTSTCKALIQSSHDDLDSCIETFQGCGVSDHCLSLLFKDSFYRLLMHELVHFHHLDAKSMIHSIKFNAF